MDWPKAKTILIIGFLLVDLYLAWLLYDGTRVNVVTKLGPEDVQELATLCRHYGFELVGEPVPLEVGRATNLTLAESANQAAAAETAANTWLQAGWTVTRPAAGGFLYQQGERSLKVVPDRYRLELALDLSVSERSGTPGTPEESTRLAREFLATYLGQKDALLYQAGLVTSDQGNGTTTIELNRLQQGLPSFMDYYRIRVRGNQVVGFQASQSYASDVSGKKQQLVASDRPLTHYLAQAGRQNEDSHIIDLRLGFGLLPGDDQTLQPVWRLITSTAEQGHAEVFFPAGVRHWGGGSR